MSAGTVSGAAVDLLVGGRPAARLVLRRHLSPRAVGALLRALPVEGNAHRLAGAGVYVETPVRAGAGRPRRGFGAGDVAFMPAVGGVCVFTGPCSPGAAMGLIGRVDGGLDALASVGSGDVVALRAA